MSESPATADQSTETRPRVYPGWVKADNGELRLYFAGAQTLRSTAAEIRADCLVAWPDWPETLASRVAIYHEPRNGRPLDECKRLCVKALRGAGYAFVGDPEPAAKPGSKGRILRRWVRGNGSHVLLRETGLTAGWVDSLHIEAWQEGPPAVNRMFRRSPRGVLALDEAKALAEQWLTEAGYEIVDPPVEPAPAACANGACDCGGIDPDDRITLPEAVEASAYRYLRKPAVDAIDAELARGTVPLGVVDWCPGPEFRLFTTAEMTVRARELLDAIEADHTDSALWARLAALAAAVISVTGREAESG